MLFNTSTFLKRKTRRLGVTEIEEKLQYTQQELDDVLDFISY